MAINEFQGDYRYLSNFWYTTVINTYDNDKIIYKTVEHAFQAAKSADISDRYTLAAIQSPYDVKKAGRSLILRPKWEQIKYDVMLNLVRNKFAANTFLNEKLISTYPHKLIEGNDWHDNSYGECYCDACASSRSLGLLTSHNMLGKILQHVRFENRLKLGLDN